MPLPNPNGTLLVFYSPLGIPFYSCRGLTQSLEPIKAKAQYERNINGALVDLSLAQFEKYLSKITCNDQNAPALSGIWQGMTLVVDCCQELGYATGGTPNRPLATGTVTRDDGNGFTFFFPKITFMITGWSQSFEEYPHKYPWSIDLEEV